MNENETKDQNPVIDLPRILRRRNLLPWWIIGFIWIFFLFFAMIPAAVVFGLLKFNFQLSLLGLSTGDPISITGLFIMLLFALKGVVAFMLWTEKTQAVKFAKIDAIVSAAICCLVMIYALVAPSIHMINLRLELIAIIPYYLKMSKIQYDWEYFGDNDVIPDTYLEINLES